MALREPDPGELLRDAERFGVTYQIEDHEPGDTDYDVGHTPLLFVIDETPFKAAVAASQATLDQTRAELEQAEKSQAVPIAQAQLLVSQAVQYLAQVQETRSRRLLERVSITREEYEEKKSALQQADADVQARKADLEQARVNFDSNIALAKAKVAKAETDAVWLAGLPERLQVITTGQGFVAVGEQVGVEVVPQETVAVPAGAPA